MKLKTMCSVLLLILTIYGCFSSDPHKMILKNWVYVLPDEGIVPVQENIDSIKDSVKRSPYMAESNYLLMLQSMDLTMELKADSTCEYTAYSDGKGETVKGKWWFSKDCKTLYMPDLFNTVVTDTFTVNEITNFSLRITGSNSQVRNATVLFRPAKS